MVFVSICIVESLKDKWRLY